MKNLLPKKTKINLDYASAVYAQLKKLRYGLASCSNIPDLDLVYMRKELLEWQSNEDHGALTDVSYNYDISTVYLPISYDADDQTAYVGGPMEHPELHRAPGIVQSFNHYDPRMPLQDMRHSSVTRINYNTSDHQSGANVIDINSGGCVTRINLNNTVNIKTQNFEFIQDTEATIWDIQHNLGFNPNVRLEDSDGTDIVGSVEHLSANRLKITFNQAVAGKAYLS